MAITVAGQANFWGIDRPTQSVWPFVGLADKNGRRQRPLFVSGVSAAPCRCSGFPQSSSQGFIYFNLQVEDPCLMARKHQFVERVPTVWDEHLHHHIPWYLPLYVLWMGCNFSQWIPIPRRAVASCPMPCHPMRHRAIRATFRGAPAKPSGSRAWEVGIATNSYRQKRCPPKPPTKGQYLRYQLKMHRHTATWNTKIGEWDRNTV
jgi:hypothetical protein